MIAARPPSALAVARGRPIPILPAAPRRLRLSPPHAASKGFGGGGGGAAPSNNKPPSPPKKNKGAPADTARVKTADPEVQRAATLLLTALVAETDPEKRSKLAADNVGTIDGTFFAVADAYIKIARSEGRGEDVAAGLEEAVRCALDAKQATLRPEIRLLNRLLDAPSLAARREVLEAEGGAGAHLLRERASREYLNQLLDTFQRDVEGQAKAAKGGGDSNAVAGLKKAIEETRSIVLAAVAASASAGGGGGAKS